MGTGVGVREGIAGSRRNGRNSQGGRNEDVTLDDLSSRGWLGEVAVATRLTKIPALIGLILSCVQTTAARADMLNTYVVLSCDAANNKAMLRFGYADEDEAPKFVPLPHVAASDLSRQPVPANLASVIDPKQAQEVSCTLRNGNEVRARYLEIVSGNEDIAQHLSVWVGGKKVISDRLAACRSCLYHSVFVQNQTSRICEFRLGENGNPYNMGSQLIVCQKTAALNGKDDFIEYPRPGDPLPPAVSTLQIIRSGDDNFCKVLIADVPWEKGYRMNPSGRPRVNQTVVPWGEEIGDKGEDVKFSEPIGASVSVSVFDFANEKQPQRVYRVSAETTNFNRDIFVVTDLSVPRDQVVDMLAKELSPEGDIDAISRKAIEKGWLAFPAGEPDNEQYKVFRYSGSTYLLGGDENGPIVYKPDVVLNLGKVCVYHRVEPNL